MSILEALILGIIQGLTEFIPISSSGHLVIMQQLLGVSDGGLAFDVALHIGTLLALFIYFWADIKLLVAGLLGRNPYRRLAWLVAAATVPAVLAGIWLQAAAETSFRSIQLVAFNLLVVGGLMIVAEAVASHYKSPTTTLAAINWRQALLIGIAQVLALIPGVSRSGSTITAGLFVGLERLTATRFSFLLAIPITLGAIVKVLLDGSSLAQMGQAPAIFSVGIGAALLSGLWAIKFLMAFLARHSLRPFAYYRIGLAVIILVLA